MVEPLHPADVAKLATFNTQRAQGLHHDPDYAAAMADLQARFDAVQADPTYSVPAPGGGRIEMRTATGDRIPVAEWGTHTRTPWWRRRHRP